MVMKKWLKIQYLIIENSKKLQEKRCHALLIIYIYSPDSSGYPGAWWQGWGAKELE